MLEGVVTWAEIDLDAIAYNVAAFKKHIGPNVRLMAVVKANAYGHGTVPVAQTALEAGADMLAVHRLIEGIALRSAGIQAPILVMGYTTPDGAALAVQWHLTPSLMTIDFAEALSKGAQKMGVSAPVHVKVDSGMSRYGLMPDEVPGFLKELSALPGIEIEGLFTHFATADSADQTHLRRQLEIFSEVVQTVRKAGMEIPIVHAANSAATMHLPEAHFDAVRPGIALYGMDPSSEWEPVFEIHPALTLKSRVGRVRTLPAGSGVSYGRTYVAARPTKAALVPVGYGDGYHRVLSSKGSVLIRGHRAPIIGRVCMDQFVVDASDIPDVAQDDEVVILGRQGSEQIRSEEIAALAGTINYEVTTSILPRVVRVFIKSGRIVQMSSISDPV